MVSIGMVLYILATILSTLFLVPINKIWYIISIIVLQLAIGIPAEIEYRKEQNSREESKSGLGPAAVARIVYMIYNAIIVIIVLCLKGPMLWKILSKKLSKNNASVSGTQHYDDQFSTQLPAWYTARKKLNATQV